MPELDNLAITLITDSDLELMEALTDALREAYGDEYQEPPDDELLAASFRVLWSLPVRGDATKRLHRVLFDPSVPGEGDDTSRLANDLCDELRGLIHNEDIAVDHVVWFQHPHQLAEHGRFHAELYDVEMRLRDVLTYIFLDIAPDRCYSFLDGNEVKPQNADALTDEYLLTHGENKLFHILFADYPKINQSPVTKPNQVISIIAEEATYDELRARISDVPIKQSRHAGLVANLVALINPIEEVRNAVAHHRAIPNRARQNYPKAKQSLLIAIEEFWEAERQDREEQQEQNTPAAAGG